MKAKKKPNLTAWLHRTVATLIALAYLVGWIASQVQQAREAAQILSGIG